MYAGENPTSAIKIKILGNFLVATIVESFSEAFAIARKGNMDTEKLTEVINLLFPAGGLNFNQYANRINHGNFHEVGASVLLGLKDVGLVKKFGDEFHCPLPLADLMHAHLTSTVARGRGEWDWTAVSSVINEMGGLEAIPKKEEKKEEKK